MSAGVVYFVNHVDNDWICIPRSELRRVCLRTMSRGGVGAGPVGLHVVVWLADGTKFEIPLFDNGADTTGATSILDSLTQSVDTDVTWTKNGPRMWERSESRPQ